MPNAFNSRTAPPALVPETMALFLDVDGVLLDFVDEPDAVVVNAALIRCLDALLMRHGGALALVSGRRIEALDALFAPLHLPCAGLHGLEWRHVDGVQRHDMDADALHTVRADAQAIVARHPGALCEDKGMALALHWRAAAAAGPELQAFAQRAVAELPGYHLQPGNQVVELKPDGADKGSAIAAFLKEPPFVGRLPVFLGDDLTDEHGFDVVNRQHGCSVLVGRREPSAARYVLPDVAAVHRWLGVDTVAQPQVAA